MKSLKNDSQEILDWRLLTLSRIDCQTELAKMVILPSIPTLIYLALAKTINSVILDYYLPTRGYQKFSNNNRYGIGIPKSVETKNAKNTILNQLVLIQYWFPQVTKIPWFI